MSPRGVPREGEREKEREREERNEKKANSIVEKKDREFCFTPLLLQKKKKLFFRVPKPGSTAAPGPRCRSACTAHSTGLRRLRPWPCTRSRRGRPSRARPASVASPLPDPGSGRRAPAPLRQAPGFQRARRPSGSGSQRSLPADAPGQLPRWRAGKGCCSEDERPGKKMRAGRSSSGKRRPCAGN